MLRKIPCQPGRKPKNIEESKREEEIPLTESNVELLISEPDLFTTPLRLNHTLVNPFVPRFPRRPNPV